MARPCQAKASERGKNLDSRGHRPRLAGSAENHIDRLVTLANDRDHHAESSLPALPFALIATGASAARADDPVNKANSALRCRACRSREAEFTTTLRDQRYNVAAALRTTGLARIITDTKAEIKVDGLAGRKSWRPRDFSFHYDYGRRSRSFRRAFCMIK